MKIDNMKYCNKCKNIKSTDDFYKCKSGYQSYCKECKQKYAIENINKTISYKEKHYKIYKDKIKKRVKQFKLTHKKQRREQNKTRYINDPNFKLVCSLRNRIYKIVKGKQKGGSAVKDLGCSIQELKEYLEKQFKPGMNWKNHSNFGWHVDHIKPISKFDLTNREQFLEACHYTNLQPLWWHENLSKRDKEED